MVRLQPKKKEERKVPGLRYCWNTDLQVYKQTKAHLDYSKKQGGGGTVFVFGRVNTKKSTPFMIQSSLLWMRVMDTRGSGQWAIH